MAGTKRSGVRTLTWSWRAAARCARAELFRHWGQHEVTPFEVRLRVDRAEPTMSPSST